MNKQQKSVIQYKLDEEKKVLEALEKQYQRALNDIDRRIRILESDELTQSRIYRIEYQKALRKQIEAVLEKLHADQYSTIQQFLSDAYTTGYIGNAYDLHSQGVPLILPIDPKAAVKAVMTDSQISEGLYTALGVDTKKLKKTISSEITRGLSAGMSHNDIARNIASIAKAPLSRAKTIVRTEAHRIAQAAIYDNQKAAVAKGANVVKQWMSTLDGDTRKSHRKLDGQIREIDEPFEMDGKKAMYPGKFGDPAEDCNCRCEVLQRARLALNEDELKTLEERAKFFGLDKTDDFEDFKSKYLKAAEQVKAEEARPKFVPAKTIEEAEEYGKRFIVDKSWSGVGNISYKGLSVDSANTLNETLEDMFYRYDVPKLDNILPMNFREQRWKQHKGAPLAYDPAMGGDLRFDPKIIGNKKNVEKYFAEAKKAFEVCAKNIDKLTGANRELVETYVKAGRSLVAVDVADHLKALIDHEFGHHIQNRIIYRDKNAYQTMKDGFAKFAIGISGYATQSEGEYIAESFCAFLNGEAERIDPELKKFFEGLVR